MDSTPVEALKKSFFWVFDLRTFLFVNKENFLYFLFVYVIAWARGQLRINFTRIFKVFTKLPESRSDEGNLENFENASEINP